jgi:hypothetical protein
MRNLLVGGLLSVGLFAVGCKDARIKTDDVNDLNPKKANNAIFTSVVEAADLDGDGVDDFDITVLTFIASDQDDLCAAIEADADALANLPDLQSVQVTAIAVADLGAGEEFAEGAIEANTAILDLIFAPAAGNIGVTGGFTIREGGVDKVAAFDDAIFEVGDAVLDLKKFAVGEAASADFSTTLTQETADDAFFDTDQDGDGVNDFQALDNVLEVTFKNVAFCDAL